jgi:hypothetical protein
MAFQPAKLKPYLILLVILLIAFLPVSTLYFGMKNDAFSDNFPNKFFFTEAIRSGFLPLWNPYLNFGFPIYADPGFAFWNPITWLFGAVIGYNAYTLTAEVLLFIYISGIAMFRLSRHLHFSLPASIATATMFMCSGFFTGQLQHINFLTSAAFLPLLIQQLLTLFTTPNYKNASLFSASLYMTFAGGHPAMPIGTIYFLISLSICIFIFNDSVRKKQKILLQYLLLSVFIFLLLYSPAIYSYLTVMPYYVRGEALDQFSETTYGFSPGSYLSFIFPFATVKDAKFLTDDLSMRNAYFSLAGFALVVSQLKSKNYLIRSLLLSAAVMLVFSSGGYIKGALYSFLPLLRYVRTNGEFRIFSILCFCLVAGYGLNELILRDDKKHVRFQRVIQVLLCINLLTFFFVLFNLSSQNYLQYLSANFFKEKIFAIKFILDNLNFGNTLFLSCTLNVICLSALLIGKTNIKKITFIIVADLIINSITYLPFSGIGTTTLSAINDIYNKHEKSVIKPSLTPIKDIDTFSLKQTGLIGSASFYNKKIGITHLTNYPSYFSNTEAYFKSAAPDTVNNLPYIFLKKDVIQHVDNPQYLNKALTIDFFSPQKINIKVDLFQSDTLVLLQNYYKFWRAKVDGLEIPVARSFITFMSVPLSKGNHMVEFYYEDKILLLFVTLALTTLIVMIVLLTLLLNSQASIP